MSSQWAAAAQLVRRTGFGATGDAVDAVVREGSAAYVARIVAADPSVDPGAKKTVPPSFPAVPRPSKDAGRDAKKARQKQLRAQDETLTAWWLRRMVTVEQPFGEKSTFVWHAHFATSLKKVKIAPLMLRQNETLRTGGRGDFGTLAYAMLTDPAMLIWLDGQKNTAKGPNENLAREFMEVFTLGHSDGYTETDVRQGARALTGWKINPRTGAATVLPKLHDSGSKTFLGRTGDLDAKGYCAAVLAEPGCPRYVVTRMWGFHVSDNPPPADVLNRLLTAYGPKRDLRAMFTAMFTDPGFAAAQNSFIIGPVEWLIGALRALRVPLTDDALVKQVAGALDALGQLPFFPPSVGGWPPGPVWMSTAAADLRFHAASLLAQHADLSTITGSTTARLEALAHLLGVASWSARSLAVLKGSAGDPRKLVTVALNTPEYLVH